MVSKKGRPTNIGPALHVVPDPAVVEMRAKVLAVADEVFDRYVLGESLHLIAESLPFKIAAWKLRQILIDSEETREIYANANILRSHNLVDQALDFGRQAAAQGDAAGLKVAIDTNLKVAGKINSFYGDKSKVELTGDGGGPVKLLALTDEELLKIAAQGVKEQAQ